METINLNFDDLEPIHIDFSEPTPSSTNFGSGIELLMNDKIKSPSSAVDMKDLDDIEKELNTLSSDLEGTAPETKSVSGFSSFFGGNSSKSENIKIITEDDRSDSRVGQDTMDSISGNQKTWDGYSKMSDVPVRQHSFAAPSMSDREKRRKKRIMLKHLDDWHDKGLIKTPTRFTMDSNYEEIEDEYEGALEDKRRKDAVKIQQNWMVTMINTIEYGNAFFNPFDINLDGWGESVSEEIDSYDEIFEQLYEKYKGGKMSPELSLLLKLGFSASVIHFSNTSLSRAIPGFGDVIRQNPDLMKAYTTATVDSMKKSAPGMAFASELLSNNKPSSMTGPPPVPVDTRTQPAPQRPGMQFTQMPGANRPDISMGRGAMFREQGVDIHSTGHQVEQPPTNYRVETQERSMRPPMPPTQRPEMTGPRVNIDNILSGLKTKTVNIRESMPPPQQQQPSEMPVYTENDSLISIASLKDMQNATMPKRTNRRKQRSDKNVVSLDI